jgi:uncharacterized damage-inducible protein DinB
MSTVSGAGAVSSEFVAGRWTAMGEKIVRLAEAFPAERFDARPTEGVRSFAEQLRHVAFWNDYLRKTLRGEPADGDANELPAAEHPSKDDIVRVLRRSFGAVADEIGRAGRDAAADAEAVLPFVEHNAEHYGQLAVYCRLGGVVPPASRG